MAFPPQSLLGRQRSFLRNPGMGAPAPVSGFRAPPGLFWNRALARRRELHPRAPRLGETDSDRLLGGTRTMLPFADVMHFLANELSRLGRGGFAPLLVPASSCDCSLLWHRESFYLVGRCEYASWWKRFSWSSRSDRTRPPATTRFPLLQPRYIPRGAPSPPTHVAPPCVSGCGQ